MSLSDGHQYDDSIMLPRHISKKHPPMAASNRAAQFLPFAALTGYDAAIQEAARRTDSFIELDESRKSQLDMQLRLIRENLDAQPEIEATYFQPDEKKYGGAYVPAWGRVKAIDGHSRRILFADGKALPIERIFSIRGELFKHMDSSGA